MKQKSLIKNALYNFLYTGLNLLFPLIVSPYISRTLGASNLGKVNFATSIVSWFLLFATFGTATYGVREVAKQRDNKEKLSKLFSEIVVINGVLSLIVTIIYFVLVININQFSKELPLYLIMSLSIILNMFAIDWFYQGIEEYKYITIRSAIFKLISLVSIFLFVHEENHYVIYGLVSVLAISLSSILNFVYSKKFARFSFKGINPFKHIKSLNIFFINTLIISIYTNLDQTLLGFFVNTKSVAYMNRSKAITGLAISISTAISNVTLPRASYYIDTNKEKFNDLLKIIPKFILWITIPITVGIVVLAPNLMFLLGGEEFIEASVLLQIISLIIIFSPLAGYLQNQILIPTGNEKFGLYAALFSSIVSLILNFTLIPTLGYLGAGFTVVIAELISVTSRYYIVKYKLEYNTVNFWDRSTRLYLISALLMGGLVLVIRNSIENSFVSLVVGAILGSGFYFLVLLLSKETVMMLILSKIKNKKNS
ncbi:oligosaccharide flippase family protein [Carnobacterium sp. CS13]|uniref:oligosaccharide flippase family protein n=1 Tax=Carnobacterium sp. CS13 TaxID=2800128 RepID=UPI001912C920|nr:oligosaccharide flippase family protein [Carnobacterium sp. CS13]QQP69566.1 oligosaccharide flippase family protein [Carnobacterium sp. CS13]